MVSHNGNSQEKKNFFKDAEGGNSQVPPPDPMPHTPPTPAPPKLHLSPQHLPPSIPPMLTACPSQFPFLKLRPPTLQTQPTPTVPGRLGRAGRNHKALEYQGQRDFRKRPFPRPQWSHVAGLDEHTLHMGCCLRISAHCFPESRSHCLGFIPALPSRAVWPGTN